MIAKPLSLALLATLLTALPALSGCANNRIPPTSVHTGNISIELRGCEPDVVTVWNSNATIKTGQHAVTVDENFVTVDGRYINRPKFRLMTLTCSDDRLDVKLDGQSFESLLAQR